MRESELQVRLSKVRHRFAGTLESKIKDNFAVFPHLSGSGTEVHEHVAEVYRRLHEICALGPTVGFLQTGNAARAAEVILLEPHLAQRGLTLVESAQLKKALDGLWSAARVELQTMYSRGG
jgi:hypothetical protein